MTKEEPGRRILEEMKRRIEATLHELDSSKVEVLRELEDNARSWGEQNPGQKAQADYDTLVQQARAQLGGIEKVLAG